MHRVLASGVMDSSLKITALFPCLILPITAVEKLFLTDEKKRCKKAQYKVMKD